MATGFVDSIKSVDGGRIKWHAQDSGIRLPLIQAAYDIPRCVPHTTESSRRPAYATGVRPTIDIGPDVSGGRSRIVQYVPLGFAATALRNLAGGIETNRQVLFQIEQIALTTRDLWVPPNEMLVQLASVAEFLEEELGIPQVYPYDPKQMASGIWATPSNPWRRSRKFETRAGWHPHAAVDENDHWDCGGEQIGRVLRIEPDEPKMVDAFQLMASWYREDTKHRESESISPHYRRRIQARRYFVSHPLEIWRHIRRGRKVWLAHRQVDESKVR